MKTLDALPLKLQISILFFLTHNNLKSLFINVLMKSKIVKCKALWFWSKNTNLEKYKKSKKMSRFWNWLNKEEEIRGNILRDRQQKK